MADNINALDAALATIILAAKEIAGVKYPRSILTDSTGADLAPLTDAQLRAAAVPVSGPLTDAQIRATALPVSAASLPLPTGAATQATLAGLLTDTQLRASAVPVSAAALPLPSGAATQATLATLLTAAQAIQSAAEALNTKTNTTTAAHFAPGFDLAAGVGFVLSAGKPTTTYTLRLRGTLAAAAGQVEATVALFVTDNIINT